MAKFSTVQAREIRCGLFNIRWELRKDLKEKGFCQDYVKLKVYKSSWVFDMGFEYSVALKKSKNLNKSFTVKDVSQEELENDSEEETEEEEVEEEEADEYSVNGNEPGDDFDEDGSEIGHEGNEEDSNNEGEHDAKKPEDQTDESSSHLNKTEICPMHMWIYTSESVSGIEKQLVKDDFDNGWRVDWCDSKLPEFINLWIDFGTESPTEKNVIKTMSGLASMFHDQHRCDVKFRFKDEKSIDAHILILSVGSPVFSAMFQSGFLESQTREVTITDIDLEIFLQLLDYLYTGSAPKLADENITQLLFEAADKYSVENLKSDCLEALQERVRLDNVVNLLVWSNFHSTKPLFDMALDFIVNNFRKLFVQADFEDFLKNYPDLCLMVMKRVASLPCQCDQDETMPSTESSS
ncbi:uncharacterized protein LOC124350663 [Daphnia pulicaria]|uniref:uncharacterized protein LOC124350663 n=1 Tax=Daphnia pulicaria TaxID=35523 RepID=UPI001EECE3D1|nr:uncharacterized protein LOC124350663 [Daphnia pulicaria]